MYVDRNEIRKLVAGATDGGWDCVGVCYGVPDFGERVIEDMPQVAMIKAGNAAAEKIHQLLMRRHDAALGCLTGIGFIRQPDDSFLIEVRVDPRCRTRPEELFPEVPSSVDGFQVVFRMRSPAVAFGGLGDDPDGDCARIPPTWFRPSWVDDPNAERRCPPGYEAIGLRCMGPCGGYWCKPVGAPGGFGQTSDIPGSHAQEGAFPVGVAAVVFGVILGGFVLSFFVKRSPAGRWRLER